MIGVPGGEKRAENLFEQMWPKVPNLEKEKKPDPESSETSE